MTPDHPDIPLLLAGLQSHGFQHVGDDGNGYMHFWHPSGQRADRWVFRANARILIGNEGSRNMLVCSPSGEYHQLLLACGRVRLKYSVQGTLVLEPDGWII